MTKFSLVSCVTILVLGTVATAELSNVFDVKEYGAIGDGKSLDTSAINKAIEQCNAAGGGTVCFPAGVYLSGTLHLRSNVTLLISPGATLLGSKKSRDYQRGSYFERALLHGKNTQNVNIIGQGIIDGNKIGEGIVRGPHTIALQNCKNILIRDVTVRDSSDYAISLVSCDKVDIQNVTITGGWDGINMYYCSFVSILNCHLQTGDDCIAATECKNMLVTDSFMNTSCNGFRLMAGNEHVLINNCIIYGPGIYEHGGSGRHNTISGITIQPFGEIRANQTIEDIRVSNVSMYNVRCPFWLGLRNEDAEMRNISINNVTVTGAGRVSSVIQGSPDNPIRNIVLNNVRIISEGGGTKQQSHIKVYESMGDAFPILPSYGFYCRYVKDLKFHNVEVGFEEEDLRPALICEHVENVELDDFVAQRASEAESPFIFNNVENLLISDLNFQIVTPEYQKISLSFAGGRKRVFEDELFSACVSLRNVDREGLNKVELLIDNEIVSQWVWMKHKQVKEIVFPDLKLHSSGKHQIQAGKLSETVIVEPKPQNATFTYEGFEVRPLAFGNLQAIAYIRNLGLSEGTEELKLYVDGKIVSSKRVKILPGETRPVGFDYPVTGAGTRKVAINDLDVKTVNVAGSVTLPYSTFTDTKAHFYQFNNNHFYIRAATDMDEHIANPIEGDFVDYCTIYLKGGIKEDSVVTVKVGNPDRHTGFEGRTGIVVRNDITKTKSSQGYIILASSPSNGWSLQWDSDGNSRLDEHTELDGYSEWPNWLKLEKKGITFTGYYSTDGSSWKEVGTIELPSANSIQDVGMFVSFSSAEFEDFSIRKLNCLD